MTEPETATAEPPPEGIAPHQGSVDRAEIEKFARLAERWWDPAGPMRPLHRLNPLRLAFLRDRLVALRPDGPAAPGSLKPLAGLRLLDLGCGAGLVSEPLARMGATVVGADAAEESLAVACAHAAEAGLAIDYRCTTAEALAAAGERFDAVVALEIVEHVAAPAAFLADAAALVRPGGELLLSTLNRTAKAYLMAIVGAEWVLRWLPRGTHEWKRFLKPSEIARLLRPEGLTVGAVKGLVYNPLDGAWRLSDRDFDVNYLLAAQKPA